MRCVSRAMLAMKRARSASAIGSCSSSAAPRIADSGPFTSCVIVCT